MSSKIINQFEEFIVYVETLNNKFTEETWQKPVAPGKWTLKQLICHLWNWDVYSIEQMIPLMKDGAQLPEFLDFDSFNDEAIEKALLFVEFDTLIIQFVETRRAMIKRINEIYDSSIRFTIGKGKRQFSIDSYVKIFVHHDEHHKKQIEAINLVF
jgi:hypothetical protein